MSKTKIVMLGLLAAAVLVLPNLAFATDCSTQVCVELYATDGTSVYDSGLQASPVNLTNFTLGNFTITAQGSGLPTLSLPTLMDLFNLAITSANGGTLTLILTEVNIGVPTGTSPYFTDIGGTQTAGSSIDYTACFDGANRNGTTYKCGAGTNQIGHSHFTSTAYSSTQGPVNGTNSGVYSLTQLITLTMLAHSTTSFDAAITVPEPATLSVLGFALLALGTGLRVKLFGT